MQPSAQSPQPPQAHSFCSHCGAAQTEGANFCTQCGAQAAPQPPAQQADPHTAPEPLPGDPSATYQLPGQHDATTQTAEQPPPPPPAQTAQSAAPRPSFQYVDNQPHSRIITKQPESPEVEEESVEFEYLHPNAKWLFLFTYVTNTGILLLLFAGGFALSVFLGNFMLALVSGGFTALYMIVHYIAAVIAYRHYSFEITDSAFRKKYGIFFVRTSNIPFDQVQNVNTRRTIVDRMLGLAHVDIETAGTGGSKKQNIIGGASSRSEGNIPGIGPEEAEDIKDLILRRAQQIKYQR